MKRILAFIVCVIIVCALPVVAFAEDGEAVTTAPESESILGALQETISDKIVNWILPHIEEILVVVTMIISSFYQKHKHTLLNKAMGVMNNNTIAIAENSASAMQQALVVMTNCSNAVTEYKATIEELLTNFKHTAEDKAALEAKLSEIDAFLQSAKDANIEFSNELAELLVLANIPNAKKDELYARHRAAIDAMESAVRVKVIDEVTEHAERE